MLRSGLRQIGISGVRGFRSSARALINVGDAVPSANVQAGSPSDVVNLADATAKGKYVIVGVPGAYSPACSASHVPGYIKAYQDFAKKGYNGVYVVTVNDAFVTSAWAKELGAGEGVKVVADASGEFTEAADLLFDASKFFGNARSKRYALLVQDGKVVEQFVEPDNVGVSVSAAPEVLRMA